MNKESWLSWFLRGLLILVFIILIGKLVEIQIIKGSYYRILSEENRIRHIPIPAARGRILAKNGEALADNVQIKKRVVFDGTSEVSLSEDLTNAKSEDIVTDYKRVYPEGEYFGHITGYISKVGTDEIGKVDPNCPEKGTRSGILFIGITGLEKTYECQLRGIPGEKLIEVDTGGRAIRTLAIRDPVSGKDVNTSIDLGLQKEIAAAVSESKDARKGAVVVSDTKGNIMSLYSFPGYDPNIFIGSGNQSAVSDVLTNSMLPLFNRAIGGTFHPGSVYKPAVAISALEEGAIDVNYVYTDAGYITVNGFTHANWYYKEYGRTEGSIGLKKAIARSTDTFFYKIGELTGPVNIAKWSEYFNLDRETGIDLPGEVKGLIPTPEWKQKTKRENWFLGNTYNMSIGQGDVSVTPLAVNTYIASIAAVGKICTPTIAKRDNTCRDLNLKPEYVKVVTEGMLDACSEGGTGFTFFDFSSKHPNIRVACKTGTAEVGTDGTPHAWFTFFAPADRPEIVATVLVEEGGQGSSVAGPIARKIADYYFASK